MQVGVRDASPRSGGGSGSSEAAPDGTPPLVASRRRHHCEISVMVLCGYLLFRPLSSLAMGTDG